MANETTVPLLACNALEATLDFYRTLGFEVTHEQTTPYVYGAVQRGGIVLHFYHPTGRDQKNGPGRCLIMVPEIESYHREFADALRARYGKIPTADLPRITRLQKGQTRFTTFDPSGNCLTFIPTDEPAVDYEAYRATGSRLVRAIENAAFLRDTYLNDKAAAQVLDKALSRDDSANPIERALALAARAELAVAMGDAERAQAVRAELQRIPLADEDRERHRDELSAAEKLEQWIC